LITAGAETVGERLGGVDWGGVEASLEADGFARLPVLLDSSECQSLAALYKQEARFRSRIDMARFRFGVGEYKYFAAPLPPLVQALREGLYRKLSPIANQWASRLDRKAGVRDRKSEYPAALEEFLAECHAVGQTRPTPLLLSYSTGGYNCLHQDIYGDIAFPLQVVVGLSRPEVDYGGGEFLLVEQRPRAQSRGHAVRIEQGAALVFATRERPVAGTRGDYRVTMRHGVSDISRGSRLTLGVIFHDAR
jgi:hypothetical protein